MSLSEIRKKARENLQGNWGTAVLITLIMYAILVGIEFLSGMTGGFLSIAQFIITVPIEFGLVFAFLKMKRRENVEAADGLKLGFANFGRSWGIFGNIMLKMIIPTVIVVCSVILLIVGILVIVAGAESEEMTILSIGLILTIISAIGYIVSLVWIYVKGLLYTVATLVACDNPEMSTKEAVEQSAKLMNGNRVRYFLLNLSFIGWSILATLTLGIGLLWLVPYIQMSTVVFYDELTGKNNVEIITENN